MENAFDREDVVNTLRAEFPDISEDLLDETRAGLLHLEVSCFTRYTQEQIEAGNKKELLRCYETARRLLMEGDSEVKNAVYVSYLEHLNFRDGKRPRSWARKLIPEPLSSGFDEVMEYLASLRARD